MPGIIQTKIQDLVSLLTILVYQNRETDWAKFHQNKKVLRVTLPYISLSNRWRTRCLSIMSVSFAPTLWYIWQLQGKNKRKCVHLSRLMTMYRWQTRKQLILFNAQFMWIIDLVGLNHLWNQFTWFCDTVTMYVCTFVNTVASIQLNVFKLKKKNQSQSLFKIS